VPSKSRKSAAICFLIGILACLSAVQSFGATVMAENEPLIIEGVRTSDVFAFGRPVIVRGMVDHGVLAFGGDIIVEGRVEGDVAVIGGSIIQREGSYIGGDCIIIGGTYHHGKTTPGRNPASVTVMYAGYEQELRELGRNPASFLTPRWSLAYFGQRLLSVLFWFIVSLALSLMMPGVIGRAVTRLKLATLRVALIGAISAGALSLGVPIALRFLPSALGAFVGVMALLLIIFSYLFGRTVIHVETGRWLQRVLFGEKARSESVALLLGAIFWAVALSLPVVWPLIVAGLLVVSLGLALTARYHVSWRHAAR
jgi:hypothetical protein